MSHHYRHRGESVIDSLNRRNFIVGAISARALYETACAFRIESKAIITEIENCRLEGISNAKDASGLRLRIAPKAIKMALGTRESEVLKSHPKLFQTNIMTSIDKALRDLGSSESRLFYEKLCDAVHPSAESFSAFISELGNWSEGSQLRWVMDRHALRSQELIVTVGWITDWSISRLTQDLISFQSECADLCLSSRIPWLEFEVPIEYFGLFERPDIYSPCPCGSGKKWKFCRHTLSRK